MKTSYKIFMLITVLAGFLVISGCAERTPFQMQASSSVELSIRSGHRSLTFPNSFPLTVTVSGQGMSTSSVTTEAVLDNESNIHKVNTALIVPFEREITISLYAQLNAVIWSGEITTTLHGQETQQLEIIVNHDVVVPGMVYVHGGTFSPNIPPASQHYIVTLSSYFMNEYAVTQQDYADEMGLSADDFTGDMNLPVRVSWYNAVAYCNYRSMQEGLTPVYSYLSLGTDPDNWPNLGSDNFAHRNFSLDLEVDGYRLPTEMEWEFAARGGGVAQRGETFNTLFSGSDIIDEVAWYSNNAGSGLPGGSNDPNFGLKPVGLLTPNELGIYDMTGNFSEWCWDMNGEYPSGEFTDPTVGLNPWQGRLTLRGGLFLSPPWECRVDSRFYNYPTNIAAFRIVRRVY